MEVGGYEGIEYNEPLSGVSTGEELTKEARTVEEAVLVPVTTQAGAKFQLKVFVQGNRENTPIITCHEIGLNHRICFTNLLSHGEAEPLSRKCCFYHIDLPGQSDGDGAMFTDQPYPAMDDLAGWIGDVANHFKLQSFFALGVGAGAYIFTRYIMSKNIEDPAIRGMLAISPIVQAATWREWSYDKVARAQLAMTPKGKLPAFVLQQTLAGFFGPTTLSSHLDLVQQFTDHLTTSLHPQNYSAFLSQWTQRADLYPALRKNPIAVPILGFSGGNSLREEEIVNAFADESEQGVFTSSRSSLVQIWRSGDLVHQEAAQEVAEAFKLFFRGYSIMM